MHVDLTLNSFFTDKTIVAEPLAEDMDEEIKSNFLTRRKEILFKVKQKIDDVLNPSKSTYDPHSTPIDTLNELDITEQDYQWALSISPDSDHELHLKRPIDSCFINNYFYIAGLKGFAANVDSQPVFNHYKCITYVCSYFTKDETECSQAIINAAKEAKEANLSVRDGLRKIGAAFLSTREVSAQECVYRCMPELWLRKIFPKTLFVSTDFSENRVRFAKKRQELNELDDDSTDIFKSNIIVRYSDSDSDRPKNIPVVNDMCLALFAAHYFKDYQSDFNEVSDSQPEVLSDDFIESQNIENHNTGLPDRINLVNSKEIMKCRTIKAVIRYHTPNKRKEPEKYFHHLLMLYFPWRNEQELFGEDQTYISKFYDPDVQEVVQRNKEIFEPDGDAINEALESLRNFDGVPTHSYDPINDQENEDLRHIHQRLKEIFVTPNSELFAGISVLVFGDFFQLPPIRSATTFSNYKNDTFNLHHPWHVFKMAELTQIMRQKDDLAFTQLLNRVRTASHTDDDIRCIQSRTIIPGDENYPSDALHIFAENAPVGEYNIDRLQQIQSPQYILEALDQFPPHVRKQDIERVLSKGRSETGGLDTKILIKENARVMLTTNVDISDRLINGQLGTVIKVSVDNVSNKPSTIFVKFNDSNAGVSACHTKFVQ